MFAGIYYSTQRLLKVRMASDLLSWANFWGWQLIIVAAAITYPLGLTQGKEYAELIWPIDLLVVVVWVIFAVELLLDPRHPQREEPVRGDLVLHRDHRHDRGAVHRQQPAAADQPDPQLSDLRRRAGRPGAVVVRPQRGGLLPHHAHRWA